MKLNINFLDLFPFLLCVWIGHNQNFVYQIVLLLFNHQACFNLIL